MKIKKVLEDEEVQKIVYKILITIFLIILGLSSKNKNIENTFLLLAYIVIGYEIILKGFKKILKIKIFSEEFLMSIATIGAISIGDTKEAIAVMLLYVIGELLQDIASHNFKSSIKSLLDLNIKEVIVLDGRKEKIITPEELNINDIILVRQGEKIPIDGIIVEGEGMINTSALTGESQVKFFQEEDLIYAGMLNESAVLKIKVLAKFSDSTIAKMEKIISEENNKNETEKFITKFSAIYTPIVVLTAVVVFLVTYFMLSFSLHDSLYRAITLLVISCPCALVISIPLAYFSGIAKESKNGILVKNSTVIDSLGKIDTICFDKTGTLTKGNFEVTDMKIYDQNINLEKIFGIVFAVEKNSIHPIGKALCKKIKKEKVLTEEINISEIEELRGKGIMAIADGEKIILGNEKLLNEADISIAEKLAENTVVYFAMSGKHIASFVIEDELKENVIEDIKNIKNIGINELIILSGDQENIVKKISQKTGIDKYVANLMPEEKLQYIENLKSENKKVAFIGDGINDAMAISKADVGISMGISGSDIAIETADVILNNDLIGDILVAIKTANYTNLVAKENIFIILVVKIFFILIGMLGYATIWEAIFADTGISIIATLNSIRIYLKK